MIPKILALLTSAHGFPAYGMLFSVLVACGLGLPLPEDVSLVTGGYLASLGAVKFIPMLVVAFSGILAGDFVIFAAGRRYGNSLASSRWLSHLITEKRRCRVEGYFARHGEGLVFAARFIPGLRAATYFVAGASPMAAWKFVLFDGIAACASVPIWMGLGRKFGPHLPPWVSYVVLGVAAAAVACVVLTFLRKRREILAKPVFERVRTASRSAVRTTSATDQAVGGAP